ncbi:hypothetical protein [Herbaspirillum huttiense]|uniref:hypothetical protein n=1 Tax=Herbaspirillum huttiense TaxID=863372 RepID=UPI0004126DDF|nr:hypothetical protein [Herbaspirillum huttiense]
MKRRNLMQAARAAVLASIAMMALPATAQMAEQTMREFTACNSSFFRVLAKDAAASQVLPALERKDELAWIKVKDRKNAPDNQVNFAAPVTVGDIKLLGYFDEITDLQELGRYYYWGFIVDGTVAEVIGKLRPMVSNADRLHPDGTDYARTEVKIGSSDWIAIKTGSSSVPQKNTIERAFIIERMENNKHATRVSCSLQGAVTAAVLKTERPDVGSDDLPPLSSQEPEESDPPANVLAAIDAAAPQASVWRPRFSKISMQLSYHGKKPFTMLKEVENVNGLLHIREHYSGTFYVDRVSFAGLQQLRAEIYINRVAASGRPALTTDLTLTLPATLAAGETLTFESVMQSGSTPKRAPEASKQTCKIAQTISATDINATLTGSAVLLDCTFANGRRTEFAFLQDLGVAIQTKEGNDSMTYPEFTISK